MDKNPDGTVQFVLIGIRTFSDGEVRTRTFRTEALPRAVNGLHFDHYLEEIVRLAALGMTMESEEKKRGFVSAFQSKTTVV